MNPSLEGYQIADADLTLTIDREDLEEVMMGAKSLADQIADGTATFEGDLSVLEQLGSTMVHFEVDFEILPGTKGRSQKADLNDFELGPLELGPE